jgi:hypothetical protein
VARGAQPLIDNERVTVWDATATKDDPSPVSAHKGQFLTVYLVGAEGGRHKVGDVVLSKPGESKFLPGERAMVVELKDHPVPPIPNPTTYQLAFPRPHAQKVLENDRILVWKYAWTPGEPTPVHFHDKDVVVLYMEDTALKSTTPDGKTVLNDYKKFQIKFNARDRAHSELLDHGNGSAIMMELK